MSMPPTVNPQSPSAAIGTGAGGRPDLEQSRRATDDCEDRSEPPAG
jgi:hypothetical protein